MVRSQNAAYLRPHALLKQNHPLSVIGAGPKRALIPLLSAPLMYLSFLPLSGQPDSAFQHLPALLSGLACRAPKQTKTAL